MMSWESFRAPGYRFLDRGDCCALVARHERDASRLEDSQRFLKRLLRRWRRDVPAGGLQNREPARLQWRGAGRRTVEAWMTGVAPDAPRDLVGDLPSLRQAGGDRSVRAL